MEYQLVGRMFQKMLQNTNTIDNTSENQQVFGTIENVWNTMRKTKNGLNIIQIVDSLSYGMIYYK